MALPETQALDSVSDSEEEEVDNGDLPYGYLIRINEKDEPTETFELNKKTITIGRKKSNDIVLTDNTISSLHCELGMFFYLCFE